MTALERAMRTVVQAGFTPVDTLRYERLRSWLDIKGYWPPPDWPPPVPSELTDPQDQP